MVCEVVVTGLAIDAASNSPVVLLKETGGERLLPIWIGPAEASAIAMQLAGIKMRRPLTHDLLKDVIDGLDVRVTKVVINDLIGQTFHAEIYLQQGQSMVKIDARPSDSIALALRTKSPIFVEEKVLALEGSGPQETEERQAQELRERLKRIDPEDFGNFTL